MPLEMTRTFKKIYTELLRTGYSVLLLRKSPSKRLKSRKDRKKNQFLTDSSGKNGRDQTLKRNKNKE